MTRRNTQVLLAQLAQGREGSSEAFPIVDPKLTGGPFVSIAQRWILLSITQPFTVIGFETPRKWDLCANKLPVKRHDFAIVVSSTGGLA